MYICLHQVHTFLIISLKADPIINFHWTSILPLSVTQHISEVSEYKLLNKVFRQERKGCEDLISNNNILTSYHCMGSSINDVTLFGTIFDSPSPHCHAFYH